MAGFARRLVVAVLVLERYVTGGQECHTIRPTACRVSIPLPTRYPRPKCPSAACVCSTTNGQRSTRCAASLASWAAASARLRLRSAACCRPCRVRSWRRLADVDAEPIGRPGNRIRERAAVHVLDQIEAITASTVSVMYQSPCLGPLTTTCSDPDRVPNISVRALRPPRTGWPRDAAPNRNASAQTGADFRQTVVGRDPSAFMALRPSAMQRPNTSAVRHKRDGTGIKVCRRRDQGAAPAYGGVARSVRLP